MSNQGEVELLLDGKTETLRSSLGAAKTVNGSLGGFAEAFRKIVQFDFDAYVIVIAAGLGKKRHEVEQAVYNTGLTNLSDPVAKYVGFLSNGGRDPQERDNAKPGEA